MTLENLTRKGRIFFAPLNIGTGLQNKLLEAMAMGIPCITSSLANNALKATDKKEILIGNTPEEYKRLILNLLSDTDQSDSDRSCWEEIRGKHL